MPQNKSLANPPYSDDFDIKKDYYRVLFKPSQSVQVRELNQLQSILQNQIESFGSQIYKAGTVIAGCGFSFNNGYSYVKLKDTDGDSNRVIPENLIGFFVRNSNGVVGIVQNGIAGFESQLPDLNTIYVKYISSSDDLASKTFSADQSLTVYSNSSPIESIIVGSGGSSFGNSDFVVILPAVQVNVTSGSFSVGANVHQTIGGNTANAVVLSVNAIAGTSDVILSLKPYSEDLSNSSLTAQKWTFSNTVSISTDTGDVGTIDKVIGTGAAASLITDGSGIIVTIIVTSPGSGYSTLPFVTVKTNSTAIASSFTLTPRTYKVLVTVAGSGTTPIGNGYSFGITEGTVYQEGFFLHVEPQSIVVSKYSSVPDGLIVGLEQKESIVSSAVDTSLLDNATGTPNFAAPGADRLKITPTLEVINTTATFDSNTFFVLSEFIEGQPAKQFKNTQYSGIGDEMAKRTFDASGSFVVDPFLLGTKDKNPTDANTINCLIDPGLAYINGYRVETFYNSTVSTNRGIAVANDFSKTGSFNIGNYVRVTELGGSPEFKTGNYVQFRTNAVGFITAAGNAVGGYANLDISANTTAGAILGSARIRSVTFEDGTEGTNTAIYKLYLFDVSMNSGLNFSSTRSICILDSSNVVSGFADPILSVDPVQGNVAILVDTSFNSLIFPTGHDAIKTVNNASYKYKTSNTYAYASNGQVTITLVTSNETHPYTDGGSLTTDQIDALVVVPTVNIESTLVSANVLFSNSGGGIPPIATLNASTWPASLKVGDYIRIANATVNTYTRVDGVINTSAIYISSNTNYSNTTTTGYAQRLPANIPIPTDRTYRSGSLDGTGKTLTLTLPVAASTNSSATANVFVVFPVFRTSQTPVSKTINRNQAVRILISNSASNTVGPWDLGIPDIARLDAVYKVQTDTVASVTINGGGAGSGYSNGDALTFTSGSGTGAAGFVTTDGSGAITNTTITNMGSGYASAPTIGVTTGGGSAAALTGHLNDLTTINTASEIITNKFFIDSGEKSGYYGLGKLVLSPKNISSDTPLNANSVLLVIFDAFSISSFTGYFDLASYSINDAINLESSTSTINTVEIPEYQSTTDLTLYFDLRDSLDFRPFATNNAVLTSTIGSSTINPIATINFSASDKFWPDPDETYEYGVSYYLGYTATIVLDATGTFLVIAGDSSEKFLPPPSHVPGSTMKINNILVPPYPSLPAVPSTDVVTFLDKKVGNSTGAIDSRRLKYTIKIPFTTAFKDWQPARYTMKDIGRLEQRITTLEYYTSLSLLESSVLNKNIPSSGNSALGRFINGFVVDGFDNYNVVDVLNPEFSAEVSESALSPNKKSLKLNIQYNIAPHFANGAVNPTNNYISSLFGFDENGDQLDALDISANGDGGKGVVATMPFTEVVAVNQETFDGPPVANVAPGITPPPNINQSSTYIAGNIRIRPSCFDILGKGLDISGQGSNMPSQNTLNGNTIFKTSGNKNNVKAISLVRNQVFRCGPNGLKPLTQHYVYFGGILVPNNQVGPFKGNFGEPLISNKQGSLNDFKVQINLNIPSQVSSLTDLYSIANNILGNQLLIITDYFNSTLNIVSDSFQKMNSKIGVSGSQNWLVTTIVLNTPGISSIAAEPIFVSAGVPIDPTIKAQIKNVSDEGGPIGAEGG